MATVRDRGYARWTGTLLDRRRPWWPVTRTGVELTFRKKKFRLFFAASFLPAAVFLVGVYVSERLEDFKSMIHGASVPTLFRVDPGFFKLYMSSELLLFMLVMLMVFAGAGLVADDLKHNALQLYFARPFRKRDYFVGKASVVAFFVLALTLVPGLLLFVMKLVFSGSFAFLRQYPWLPFSIVGYAALLTVFLAFYTLLLSASSKNSRYVSILIFMVYIFSDVAYGIFHGIFRSPYFALISIKANLQQTAAALFGQRAPFAFSPILSFLALAALCAVSALVLSRRVRGTEVIR